MTTIMAVTILFLIISGLAILLLIGAALLNWYRRRILREAGVLVGKDAEKFMEMMENPPELSQEQLDRIKRASAAIKLRESVDRLDQSIKEYEDFKESRKSSQDSTNSES